MNIYKYIFSIIISFIIISLIILFLMSLITTKIDTFAIDVMNINVSDTTELLPSLTNNLLIYLKFNNNNLTANSGRHSINATNIDTNTRFSYQNTNIIFNNSSTNFNGCTINTTDYVRGNASIQFNGSSGIIQSMNSDFINTNFTVAFYLKNINNTTGNKTIVAQALQNPTLGWMIRLENSSLKVIIGNNTDNNWTTIITVPNFIHPTTNNWYHIALTYEQSANPKWNLYLDGTKFTTTSTDNPNQELFLLSRSFSITESCGSSCNRIKNKSFGNDMHFLTLGCELTTIVRSRINTSSITTDTSYLNIGLSGGTRNINYDYGYISGGYFYIKFLSGTTTLNLPINCSAEILIVGGGGGGGQNGCWEGGGGGGGGGVGYGTINFTGDVNYSITIGDGGIGGTSNNSGMSNGTNGGNSSIVGGNINEIAYGGGGGSYGTGLNGGSGGGGGGCGGNFAGGNATRGLSNSAGQTNITYYGNNGGTGYRNSGVAGGGGAGTAGVSSPSNWSYNGNAGGNGKDFNISGSTVWYGGGGGGGSFRDGLGDGGAGGIGGGGNGATTKVRENGGNGTPNTGGGGGGVNGWSWGSRNVNAGNGGSGIIIIKFRVSDFFFDNQILYRNEEPSTFRLTNFLPNQTLMDDFRFYNVTLTENQIKTIYYGTLIAATSITTISGSDSTDCVPNELATNANLIAIPSSSALVTNISAITTTTLNTPTTSQFRQTFTIGDNNIELLFSQPLFSTTNPNPYSPIKLFNKDSSTLNDGINFCAFLSTYSLNTFNNNNPYIYNYNTDGTYALTSFSVPDCGNIRFNNGARPKGDYIYIKFTNPFAVTRYAFTGISGYASRAPAKWTLYIYNSSVQNSIAHTYPSSGNPLTERNYCHNNQRVFMVDMLTNTLASNEYLFVFHNIVGNNINENYGMLAFQELVFYKNNTNL